MIYIENITAGYQKEAMILNNFSLTIKQGEKVGIVGQNGCGKSTLAKAIMGMVPYTKGKILWENNKDLLKIPVYKKNKMKIAYFMQGGRVFGNLTVLENLKIAYQSSDRKISFWEACGILKKTNLPLFVDEKRLSLSAENLSGGEKHILSFGMVLLSCPDMKILIADEPSAGVAQVGQKQILHLMEKVLKERNVTLLLIEQNKDFLKKLTDRIVEIKVQ